MSVLIQYFGQPYGSIHAYHGLSANEGLMYEPLQIGFLMSYLFKVLPAVVALSSAASYATTFSDISEHYVSNGQLSEQVQLIDCRSSHQYNGWPSKAGASSGHFPGAINFDSQWLARLDDAHLQQLIGAKKLQKEKPTFLYCESDQALNLSAALASQGFKQLEVIGEPLERAAQSLVALPHFKQLVSAQWLNDLVMGKNPVYAPKKEYKVIEVQWGPGIKYLAAHIPGAVNLDTNDIEAEPWWNVLSDEVIASLLKGMGIRYDTTVILYGRNNMAAARAANIMMYAGVEDVRLLNGGWDAWDDAGFETQSLSQPKSTPVEFGKTIPANPQYLIDLPKAKSLLSKDSDKQSLVSIRAWDEYTGKISGYGYIKPKGRIAGSKWGHAGIDSGDVGDFLNPDGTMKSQMDIEGFWKDWNIRPDQEVAFYCGTGWRASEVFFYAYVMGWNNISVFDGGWYEWSGDKANPVRTGETTPGAELTL
jgi:thiosulfate/3-mercaptopyruvate sulfurtransferase